jgi:hypothetical protein
MSAGAPHPPRSRQMPDLEVRRATVGTRREGRRCHSAYGSHARGARLLVGSDRVLRVAQERRSEPGAGREVASWSAGIALALVYPLVRRARRSGGDPKLDGAVSPPQGDHEGTDMRKKPSIQSLETVSCEEAQAYLEHARGDELNAAYALACDRNRLDGSIAPPDDAEVHHALFLLCRAQGKKPPSFDQMRVDLRSRVAA